MAKHSAANIGDLTRGPSARRWFRLAAFSGGVGKTPTRARLSIKRYAAQDGDLPPRDCISGTPKMIVALPGERPAACTLTFATVLDTKAQMDCPRSPQRESPEVPKFCPRGICEHGLDAGG